MSSSTLAPKTSLAQRLEISAFALLACLIALLPLLIIVNTHDQFELPKQLLLRSGTALVLACFLASLALTPKVRWRRGPLDLAVLLWSAWLIVKTLHSVSRPLSWRGEYENFNGSLSQLNYSLLYFLAVQLLNTPLRAAWFSRAFERSALVVAVYALMQALQLDFIQWAQNSVISDRFFATLGNPNFLAALLVMALPLLALRAWEATQHGRPTLRHELWIDWASRVGALTLWITLYGNYPVSRALDLWDPRPGADTVAGLLLIALIATLAVQPLLWRSGRARGAALLGLSIDGLLFFKALANTGTRGAFLGLAAGALVVLVVVFKNRPKSLLPLIGAGLVLSTLALGPVMRQRLASTLRDPSHAIEISRRQIWVPALRIWREHPWTGSGVDTFKTIFPHYSTARFATYDGDNVSSRNAHSEPLQVLATLGAIGFGLWIFLLARALLAWRQAWSRAQNEWRIDLLAAGAAGAAYLGQNLVSFGVAAISAPFFVWLAFPALNAPSNVNVPARTWPAWVRTSVLSLAVLVLGLGFYSSRQTLRADILFQKSSAAQQQALAMEKVDLPTSRALAAYALQGITEIGLLDPPMAGEVNRWYQQLRDAETSLARSESAPQLRTLFGQGGQYLLFALSALQQEAASALQPNEVKYKVFVGLAWEELFKRTSDNTTRQIFFQRSLAAYQAGATMNPMNAYYQGNVARLQGLRVEAGDASALPLAEAAYKNAIHRAPVTRLFYENLMLLYLHAQRPDAVQALVDQAWATDPKLGASLAFSAGSGLYDASALTGKIYDAKTTANLKARGLSLIRRAYAQNPSEPNIPYVLGVMLWNDAQRQEAKAMLDAALRIDPGHKAALQFKKQIGLK